MDSIQVDLENDGKYTKITNAYQIASAINVPSFFLMDCLAEELRTSVCCYGTNKLEGDCNETEIQNKLDKFIKYFVTCDDCGSGARITFLDEDLMSKTCTNCTKTCTLLRRKNMWEKC